MFSRYETHYYCGLSRTWTPHELGNYCSSCGRKMRSRPRDPRQKERFLEKKIEVIVSLTGGYHPIADN